MKRPYKLQKTVSLIKQYQWDSYKKDEEALYIANKIYALFSNGRTPTPKIKQSKAKFSIYGLKTFKKQKEMTIIGESQNKECWIVKIKGNKSTNRYHKSFINKLPTPNA